MNIRKVLTIGLTICMLCGCNTVNNLENNNTNNNQEDIVTDKENNDSTVSYSEDDFIRQTKVTLVEEPACTGNASSLTASIEQDGNIAISQGGGAVIIEPGNAKYLYQVGVIACDSVILYYITEDNDLYVIDNPDARTPNQKATKVFEKKVTEFLGTEVDEEGGNLKVLLDNGEVEYIRYFTAPE